MQSSVLDTNHHYCHEFEGIHNFRDIGRVVNHFLELRPYQGRIPTLKEGFLFRSGRLDQATLSDLRRLASKSNDSDIGFGLKTVVDLRTKSEHIQAEKKREKLNKRENRTSRVDAEEEAVLLADGEEMPWETIRIQFISRRYEMQLLKELGFFRAVLFLLLMLFQFRMKAIRLVGSYVLSSKGMVGLNLDMLEFCQEEILQVTSLPCTRICVLDFIPGS
ncbi:hypothetical protein E1B28_000733 [Marasmius oreades]|uniref:Uncharacterized protein n=1 Tax=Marasmius oreades TaxID=181124 RepID=A0A9P7V1Z0_9AGAR|nr:uncharacterized protein E1B28_000733 [Marasmius oreades]KAG7098829.1 hypothetical protein E1B28_000733 [Marasmius oreades]